MRLLRDRLYKFEADINWFEKEYLQNIDNKRNEEVAKGKQAKPDTEYFENGKNLFAILSSKYETYGHTRKDFREKISSLVTDYIDATKFETDLEIALKKIFQS